MLPISVIYHIGAPHRQLLSIPLITKSLGGSSFPSPGNGITVLWKLSCSSSWCTSPPGLRPGLIVAIATFSPSAPGRAFTCASSLLSTSMLQSSSEAEDSILEKTIPERIFPVISKDCGSGMEGPKDRRKYSFLVWDAYAS
jgi:hypothetical protein